MHARRRKAERVGGATAIAGERARVRESERKRGIMNYMLRGSERLHGESSALLSGSLCVYLWKKECGESADGTRGDPAVCAREGGRTHTCASLGHGTARCFYSLREARRITVWPQSPLGCFQCAFQVTSTHRKRVCRFTVPKKVKKSTLNGDLLDFQVLKETAVPL